MATKKKTASKPPIKPPAKPPAAAPALDIATSGLATPTAAAAASKAERHVALLETIVNGLAIYLMFAPGVADKVKPTLRKVIAKLEQIVGD